MELRGALFRSEFDWVTCGRDFDSAPLHRIVPREGGGLLVSYD